MVSHDTPLTLVRGTTFMVSDHVGDIGAATHHGVFHRDVRVVSSLVTAVDGAAPTVLASRRDGADEAHWVYILAADDDGSPTAVLTRHRRVDDRVREHFVARVYSGRLDGITVSVDVATDFAELLELKGRASTRPAAALVDEGGTLTAAGNEIRVEYRATATGTQIAGAGFRWTLDLAAGEDQSFDLEIVPQLIDDEPAPGFEPGAGPAPRTLEVTDAGGRWARSIASALEDLDGLRVEVPSMGLRYLGAGAPWFMALFGRDTLLTAWQSLIAGPELTLDTLRALASRQGRREDPRTGEQPGKILHEMRTGLMPVFGVEPGTPYYGSVDASPLFVMVLGEAHRWGAADAAVRALLPAARAAMDWCIEYGDIDGDGFVEYRADERGLANQGWKDSGDSMVHADGTLATGPIALSEVQGYVYAAFRTLAQLEERLGDPAAAPGLYERAEKLRASFLETFWLPDRELVAMALDGAKKPLAVASSNPGHCLWTGLLTGTVADAAARRLTAHDVAATWGIRTLSSTEAAYNPLGYHLGSIWPHDSAIGVAGLARSGHSEGARRLADGLLETAEAFEWRLPELLGGMGSDEIGQPVPYPVACSPQAWSAAVPLLLLRTMLRLEPDVPAGVVRIAPILDPAEEMVVRGIPIGDGRLSLRVRGESFEVLDAPPGMDVVEGVAARAG
ncbi:amylo-alpha-1,6-glucosidase [Phytoactinopolyspora alkaliphila]|uniref:Amylo-alpha-1,6-glucosidase n=1 Tax=Phytoactinopolyspora alkaliphila TaxID=1783498 RepID=A0A6N9YHA7_9ACTN|nr:glycogen debranching N-terminal domain-containing protein [Phytoactinopolyspora alkaliphila]NED94288.1 amylo-alpha-1,6-glucosidase [Phytoactinopolyspora alkaliphila]